MSFGYTLMHEHTTIDLSRIKGDQDTHLNDMDATIGEFKQLYKFGVRNILDVTNMGMGRDISYVNKISEETGINIISSTGFYKSPFFPDYFFTDSVDELSKIMIKEIEDGIDDTKIKANAIGEIGTSNDSWTNDEKKLFEAAILAQKKTNSIITTHTTIGTLGIEQLNFFKDNNVDLNKVIIGHQDLNENNDEVIKILESGANVGFDTIGKNNYRLDKEKIKLLLRIQEMGLIDGVVLSLDITRKSHLKKFGGIGYSYLFEDFIPKAKSMGITEDSIDKMLKYNPKRLLGESIK